MLSYAQLFVQLEVIGCFEQEANIEETKELVVPTTPTPKCVMHFDLGKSSVVSDDHLIVFRGLDDPERLSTYESNQIRPEAQGISMNDKYQLVVHVDLQDKASRRGIILEAVRVYLSANASQLDEPISQIELQITGPRSMGTKPILNGSVAVQSEVKTIDVLAEIAEHLPIENVTGVRMIFKRERRRMKEIGESK
ncbi:unnamed protein product [Protopolystoma xenopodis]|uniref:Uncharacterized protein n=1 Tax=Protopolystoma xenopodis TaxID=117903 RepID=A0A3S5FC96_9PLAT|nr:unnamed protein product [Protopolystoma xenopodis]